MRQFSLHLFIPLICLKGLACPGGGSFAFIKYSLILLGLLYAIRGGSGYTYLRYGSSLDIARQWVCVIVSIGRSLGSQETTATGLFVFLCFDHFL